MQTLSKRMMSVVLDRTTDYRRFKQLEDATGLPSDNWKNWLYGRQRPTVEMIEAVAKTWPEYSFWMVTGISDAKNGHTAPAKEGFPDQADKQENTAKYFRTLIDMKAEAERASLHYGEIEAIPDWEPTDKIIRMGSALAARKDPEILAKLRTSKASLAKMEKLRKAEALLDNETLGLLYDHIDAVLDSAEKLLDDVNESSKPALMKIIKHERSLQTIRDKNKESRK